MAKEKVLQALLVIITGLLVIYFIFDNEVFLIIAVSIGIISLLVPKLGEWIVWLWYKIAEILGWINSRILLTLIFYLFLMPIAFFYRLFNKDPLKLKRQQKTMFKTRNHQYTKEDLINTW